MSRTEERLKESLEAVARTLPPEAVPALRLPSCRGVRIPWLAPIVAAAAVAATVIGLVALPGQAPHRAAPPATVPPLGPAAAPPRYYVGAVVPNPLAVYETATRRKVTQTTIRGITKITGTGDGRTFFASSDDHNRFYRLRITADGRIGSVDRLSIKIPAGTTADALAASRDGGRLAIALQHGGAEPGDETSVVQLVDLRANTSVLLRSRTKGVIVSLSMDPAGRTLAFSRQAWDGASQIRALDLASGSRDLMTSRLVAGRSGRTTPMGPVAVSPDGRYVVAGAQVPGRVQLIEYPLNPGPRPRVLLKGASGASGYGVLSFDPTGTNLLLEGGGHPTSRLANGKVIKLGASADADTESAAAW
jgi:hypothetical protein